MVVLPAESKGHAALWAAFLASACNILLAQACIATTYSLA